jgi:TonB family protein
MHRTIHILLLASLGCCVFAADVTSLLNAARTARRQGDMDGARSGYDSALELALAQPDSRLTATAVEVSMFYSQQNNLAKAESALKNAVDAEEQAHIAPISEASLFIGLADLYSRQQRFVDLAATQRRLMQVWETSIGPESVVVANVLYRLSETENQAGDFAAAEQSIERALTILEKTYGPDAATTGYGLSHLSTVERRLGKTDAAASSGARALAIRQKETGNAVHVGASMTAPRVLSKRDPPYSDEARKAHIQGSVLLSLVVDESGTPQLVTVLLPLGAGLDEAAIETVQKWHFQPGAKNGVPVPVQATVEINFRLL